MKDDLISRQAAIDALDKIFPADPMRNDYTQGITCGAALATEYIKQLPSAQPNSKDLVEKIQNGITASDGNSEYFIGLRNGMRWCLSLIDDKEPIYESSAQPSDEYERGWKEGREALREETWEYVRDRFD